MTHCSNHFFDEAVATCNDCDDDLCATCVVPVSTRTYCVPCALVRGGVRAKRSSSRA
jgi:hypothetical protein